MFGVCVLGSGSLGNATLVVTPGVRLLIDAGFSAKRLTERLGQLGVDPASLDGIILSHEHQDHTRGVEILTRRHGIPVFCNRQTQRVLADAMRTPPTWKLVETGRTFSLGDLSVSTFSIPHDAVDPMGFVLERGDRRLGVATDLGHVNHLVRTSLSGVHTLVLEANYDTAMLETDTRRPWAIKQRIASRHGHLSNQQTADLACELTTAGLNRIVLAHLSRDCNCPNAATSAIRTALGDTPCEIHCATQDTPVGPFQIV